MSAIINVIIIKYQPLWWMLTVFALTVRRRRRRVRRRRVLFEQPKFSCSSILSKPNDNI